MSGENGFPHEEYLPGFDVNIWLDAAQRPREYAGLDWVHAKSLLHPVLELAQPTAEHVLVDVGTGTGAVLSYLAPYVMLGIGIDISRPMLSQIDRSSGNVLIVNADARDAIPMPDEVADIVTTRMMLHDVQKPESAIAEAWRLVKPGGRLIASEYVVDLANSDAIAQTDAFEAGSTSSSIMPKEHFQAPSHSLIQLHRDLFTLKHEPERYLWTGREFEELFQAVCDDHESIENYFSVTPFNSVANWLGKSGFELSVKQNGLMLCMAAPDELKREAGIVITQFGRPIPQTEHPELAAQYQKADSETRETMDIDAKIHRVFANILVTKTISNDQETT